MSRRIALIMLALVSALVLVAGSVPVQEASSPVGIPSMNIDGVAGAVDPNPATPNGKGPQTKKKWPVPKKQEEEKYLDATDFMGPMASVPINPTAHLQRTLAEDKKYVASILRAPVDLGDPSDCKHSDIAKDELELRKIAVRINHRRVSLRQQQHWIDSATEGLRKIETEIVQTTNTARNLAEQLDALTAQKEDITNHVRRAVLLKELDITSSNLMRLKDSRMKEEVTLQKKHNKFAIRNHEHNRVLARLHEMRTKNGLALGKLADPKPYRFVQQGLDAATETQNTASNESETQSNSNVETESSNEAAATNETETEAENNNEAEASNTEAANATEEAQ